MTRLGLRLRNLLSLAAARPPAAVRSTKHPWRRADVLAWVGRTLKLKDENAQRRYLRDALSYGILVDDRGRWHHDPMPANLLLLFSWLGLEGKKMAQRVHATMQLPNDITDLNDLEIEQIPRLPSIADNLQQEAFPLSPWQRRVDAAARVAGYFWNRFCDTMVADDFSTLLVTTSRVEVLEIYQRAGGATGSDSQAPVIRLLKAARLLVPDGSGFVVFAYDAYWSGVRLSALLGEPPGFKMAHLQALGEHALEVALMPDDLPVGLDANDENLADRAELVIAVQVAVLANFKP